VDDLDLRDGWVEPDLAEEFPELGLAFVRLEVRPARTPQPVKQRLRTLSNRFTGGKVIHMRQEAVPWAYRVFFRQIGLDPDRTRTPIEQLALDRLQDGGFKTRGLPADALTIATIETGIALRAFDADKLEGALCIRDSAPGESLDGRPGELSHGTLIVADDSAPAALLFGVTADGRQVSRNTRRITIAAIQVDGVPQIAVDEALWMVAATLRAA
jgi:DNA/RNA-binding domain of Phe-tRNA-synthetase-like protein